ncbi:MAG: ribonuclease III [Clostridia bacterium]|nr:ribonuclease III [Clostridia bacterium]
MKNKRVIDESQEINCVKAVEKIIGYTFNDKKILQKAITHISYSNLKGTPDENYQRMEYLGDSILDFVVADELYRNYPQFDEGMLTKFRANIVSREPLAKIVDNSKISSYLLYDKNTTTLSKKIKSDFFESIVAAIYIDSNGLKATRQFILKYLKSNIMSEASCDNYDYKSMLYEYCSGRKWQISFVEKDKFGPPHDLTYTMQLIVNGETITDAQGKKKQDAEKLCCKFALEKFGEIK